MSLSGRLDCLLRQHSARHSTLVSAVAFSRPDSPGREVVGESGYRTHVHHTVAEQASAASQRHVDGRQDSVTGTGFADENGVHLAGCQVTGYVVVVASDAENVTEHRRITRHKMC